MIAGLLAAVLSPSAYAFHSGGVAECEGCHSMHAPKAGSFLLVGTDASSTCLTCHEGSDPAPNGYHVSSTGQSIPTERTPGGDFAWLKKSYSYAYGDDLFTEQGSTHGHNVVAVDNAYAADTRHTTAPGGSFPSDRLSCISCHDPHGRYRRLANGTIATTGAPIWASGSYPGASNEPKASGEAVGVYRLLAGNGYARDGVTFQGVPAAKVPSAYNRTEAVNQTRTAYGQGTTSGHVAWGTWCATCHPAMHSSGGNIVHPVDRPFSPGGARQYGIYVKSGTLRRGPDAPTAPSFLSLVPFVEGTGDYAVLGTHAVNDDSQLLGPTTADRVSCVSCHRAHASGFASMLRFDVGYAFMVKDGAYVGFDNPAVGATGEGPQQSRGRSIADWQAAYYDRPATLWATYQRVLCNKCHVKD